MPCSPRQTRNAEVNFRGEKRSNATHASVTDRMPASTKDAGCRGGAVLHGTYTDGKPKRAGCAGGAEPRGWPWRAQGGTSMLNRHSRLNPAPDAGGGQRYDSADSIAALRRIVVTPHVAQKAGIEPCDGRTTQHPGYALSNGAGEDRGTLRLRPNGGGMRRRSAVAWTRLAPRSRDRHHRGTTTWPGCRNSLPLTRPSPPETRPRSRQPSCFRSRRREQRPSSLTSSAAC